MRCAVSERVGSLLPRSGVHPGAVLLCWSKYGVQAVPACELAVVLEGVEGYEAWGGWQPEPVVPKRCRRTPAPCAPYPPCACRREGTLQRFGADILERLAVDKAIPRKEAWGEWVMTEQV